jgi:adenosylmethionine---8-amino-7-oxononanoate aminotransferase
MNHSTTDWYNAGLPHIWQPYAQAKTAPLPFPVSHTEGCHIVLTDGRRLIDGISSWWCAAHGHNHPHLIAAAKQQLDIMPHVMFAGLAHEPAFTLARRLVEFVANDTSPDIDSLNKVFFSDSGSTAVEVALKISLQYWRNIGQPNKTRFACLEHAYHGDTFGAMGVSDPARGMHIAYRSNLVEALTFPVPHCNETLAQMEAMFAAESHQIAALIVEPLVQGAGGMRFHSPSMLFAMRVLCKKHNVLFVADEIMTGFGRTGAMFACHAANIIPDILCIGKALTGGVMTLAATLATDKIYQAFLDDSREKALMHGATFMASPLACAVANASLDLFITEPRLEQVQKIERHFTEAFAQLKSHNSVVDVRVKGAIGVVQLDPTRFDPFAMRPRLWEKGCWLRPYGDIIYLMPPLVITSKDLQTLTDAVVQCINTL